MRQLEKEKQKKEHILVCLSSSPSNEKIIRTAAQMAQAFQAGFTALYVQTAEKTEEPFDFVVLRNGSGEEQDRKNTGESGKAAEACSSGRAERGRNCNDTQ